MVKIRPDKEKALKWAGALVIMLTAGTFALMVLGPWIPNYAGEALDAQFLAGVDARIDAGRKATFTVTFKYANDTPVQGLAVDYNQTSHDFYFGCNFFGYEGCGSAENNANYKYFFKKTFNLAVLPFYWAYAEPEQWNLVQEPWLDSALAWCEANNVTVKGYPLVWSHQAGNPGWLPEDDVTRKSLMQQRVQYVVGKYKGRVKIWDVVNEPAHWQPFYGDSKFDYVRDAFTWARAKDSSATLSINEYGVLGQDFGHGPYYNLVEQQLQAGTPVTCIGIQGHEPRTDWFPATNMWSTFEGYKALGLPIHITELMVTSDGFPITNSWKKGVWSEENQAEYLVRLYKTAFAHPSLEAVIYWELWEGAAWMQGAPLVKLNWEPKLAYTRLSALINDEWHSRGASSTSAAGTITFTGFFGNYSLWVPSLGQAFRVSFSKAGSRQVIITI
nr:endo-1,4-beta-xylanase [Candidatus Sigynarchaeum springense]